MRFLRSVIAQDESVAASSVTSYDLPVNPISHLILTVKGLNVTDEATRAEILARIATVAVLYRGQAICSLSGADLFALNAVLIKEMPVLANQIATDNATRFISLIVPMGRKLMNPTECFPATSKGQLQLQVTMSATETAIDGMILQIESVELPDAMPEQFLKYTTLARTPVTGDNDIDLPLGNKIAGILLFGTTIVATTVWTNTIESVRLLLNNVENGYANANNESLRGDMIRRIGHREDYDGSADNEDTANYVYLDYSPLDDDTYILETAGASRCHLRINAGDTNAIRAIPIEVVSVGKL